MKFSVELWQLITLATSVAIALSGGFAFLFRQLLRQFEGRLGAKFAALESQSENWHRVERDLMQLRIDLPRDYVRREDYIRNQTVIETKLDLVIERTAQLHYQGGKS